MRKLFLFLLFAAFACVKRPTSAAVTAGDDYLSNIRTHGGI